MAEVSEEKRIQDEARLKKLTEIAKIMILKYTHDKLGVSSEKIEKFIDNTDIGIDYEMDLKNNGYYSFANGNIGINSSIIYEINNEMTYNMHLKILKTVSIIMHEFEHKFSNELATDRISSQIEEGFADIFADECMGYFLEEYPEELEKFGFNAMHINRIKQLFQSGFQIVFNAYDGEADFTRSSLEVIRQKVGDAYTAEYEYIFGSKEKFKEIAKEAMGNEYIEILELQSKDINLAEKYNKKYNKMLFTILKEMPIKGEEQTQDSRTNIFLMRQYILKDIININKIREYAEKQGIDIYNLHPKEYEEVKEIINNHTTNIGSDNMETFKRDLLNGYIRNCKNINEVLQFDFTNFKLLDLNDIILSSKQFNIIDMLKFMEHTKYYNFIDNENKKNFVERLLNEVDINKLSEYTKEDLKTIVKVSIDCDYEIAKDLFNLLLEIEKVMPDKTEEDQLEINIAKVHSSISTNILDKIISESTVMIVDSTLQMKDRENEETHDDNMATKVLERFKDYLQNTAKKDPKGLKKILIKLQKYERELEQGEDKSEISKKAFEGLKNLYFDFLDKDLKFLEKMHFEVPKELNEYVQNARLSDMPENYNIKVNNELGVKDLLNLNMDTKIINVYNKKNLIELWKNKDDLVAETRTFFNSFYMDEAKMRTYIKAATEYVEVSGELNNIYDMSEFVKQIDTVYKPAKEQDIQLKDSLMEKIEKRIEDRISPEEDLEILLSMDKEQKSSFVYEKTIKNLEEKVNTGKIEFLSDTSLKRIVLKAKDDQYLQEVCMDALKQKYTRYAYMTESFISHNTEMRNIGRKAYLMSLGKEKDIIQIKSLKTLEKIYLEKHEIPINPQYIKTSNDDFVIISKISPFTFKAYKGESGQEEEYSVELAEAQNKRKKGIFALFKSKEDKEMVIQSAVLEQTDGKIKALNLYETGRFEIATLDVSRKHKKAKIINKQDVRLIDIGNNGSLVVNNSIPRKFVKYHQRKEKNRIMEIEKNQTIIMNEEQRNI